MKALKRNRIHFYLTVNGGDHECTITVSAHERLYQLSSKSLIQSEFERSPSVQVNIAYPGALRNLNNWQRSYLQFYNAKPNQTGSANNVLLTDSARKFRIKSQRSGIAKGDLLTSTLRFEEEKLISSFQSWIDSQDFQEIRDFILRKLNIPSIVTDLDAIQLNFDEIKIFIHCRGNREIELAKLPWERLTILEDSLQSKFVSRIQILRTINNPGKKLAPKLVHRKYRLLILLGQDEKLDFQGLRAIFQKLKLSKKVDVKFLDYAECLNRDQYLSVLRQNLNDDRGWDGLIVVAHSSESGQGGKVKISEELGFYLNDLRNELMYASSRGLRFAFFNSCEGLKIGQYLMNLGLHQVLLMREKIHDDAAKLCAKVFVNGLNADLCISEIFSKIQESLDEQKIRYPSASLIPSLFTYPSFETLDFSFEPSINQYLWKNLVPRKRKEIIGLTSALFLSVIFPAQDILTDTRFAIQAIANSIALPLIEPPEPIIQIIQIDQESIRDAQSTNNPERRISEFESNPIDRRYLAQIIDKLSEIDAKIVGVNYLLSEETNVAAHQQLKDTLESFKNQNPWLVFTTEGKPKGRKPLDNLVNPQWSIQGDVLSFIPWRLSLPSTANCRKLELESKACPFSFWLARLRQINDNSKQQSVDFIHSQMMEENATSFQDAIQQELLLLDDTNDFLNKFNIPSIIEPKKDRIIFNQIIDRFAKALFPYSLINYDIPPNFVSEKISSREFLAENSETLSRKFEDKIVIVSAGDYAEVDQYNYSSPLAMDYWCAVQPRLFELQENTCDRLLTSGEAYAYMTYQYVQEKNLRQVSFLWTTVAGIIIGKYLYIYLIDLDRQARLRVRNIIVGLIILGGVVNIGIFMTLNLSIPYFISSIIMLSYVQSSLGKRNGFE